MSSVGSKQTYELSRPLNANEEKIDFFISHSWHDSYEDKWEQLTAIANLFEHKHKRFPSFWLDKACINQDHIADGLRCLPVNVMACHQMLVLCGSTYPYRLWCIWEIFTLFLFDKTDGNKEKGKEKLEIRFLDVLSSDNNVAGKAALRNFQVEKSVCYDPNQENRLKRVIFALGHKMFNERIGALVNSNDEENSVLSSRSPGGGTESSGKSGGSADYSNGLRRVDIQSQVSMGVIAHANKSKKESQRSIRKMIQ